MIHVMNAASASFPAWPFGVEVKKTEEGLLLKPRRQPREGWAEAFRDPKPPIIDEVADAREVQNKFDAEEWEW
jgi:hypothetical protein